MHKDSGMTGLSELVGKVGRKVAFQHIWGLLNPVSDVRILLAVNIFVSLGRTEKEARFPWSRDGGSIEPIFIGWG